MIANIASRADLLVLSDLVFSEPKSKYRPPTTNNTLWKERQLRDFRRANGLYMYCGDKFDKAHAAGFVKRQPAQ